MPTYNRASALRLAIESVLAQSHQNWELLITDDGSTDDTESVVAAFASDPRIRYFKTDNHGVSAARNHSLSEAHGSLVAYLDSDNTWSPDYLRLMVIEVLSSEVDCAYSAVRVLDASGATLFYRGDEFDWEQCRQANYIDINALVHRRSLMQGGFEPRLRRMVDWDFILRLTRDAEVAYVPFLGCRYVASHQDPLRITRREPEAWAKVIRARHAKDGSLVPWGDVAKRLKVTFALKIAAPRGNHEEWGDFHFADSLARALESQGYEVRIDFREDWDRGERMDVNIVLRGLKELRPQRGAINILWNISHPDKVSRFELLDYDIVYTASTSHARLIGFDIDADGTTVRALMQCTDPNRFNPGLKKQASPYSADFLFVGNSRADFRPMVKWALEADLDVRVYGRGWSDIVEDPRVQDVLIDNEALGAAYANSRVVLGDHWPSMRDFGIISNRVFDVSATGTRLISDRQPALESVFGSTIHQVGSADELREAAHGPGPPSEDLQELADWVITHHTFGARVRTVVDDVLTHLNLPCKYGTDSSKESINRFRGTSVANRVKVGIAIPRGEDSVDHTTYRRLISALSTEHACGRLDVVKVRLEDIPDDLELLIIPDRRLLEDESTEILRETQRRDLRLAVDIAESYVPETHPILQVANTVWFSTPGLQQSYSVPSLADQKVVPDAIDPRIWRRYVRSSKSHPGGQGSRRLLLLDNDDFDLIFPALRHLAEHFSFELFFVGNSPPEHADETWLRISRPPPEAITHRDFARWLIDQEPFDIGLIPRRDTSLNRMRSDRDFLNYSALGLLTVASEVPPYTGVIKDRELAVITRDGDWLHTLAEIFEAPGRFRAMRERAQRYVWNERTIDTTSELLISLIEDVVATE